MIKPSSVLTILFVSVFFSPIYCQLTQRPNVIIILTDDQGSIDVNCYGAKDLYTPNMDALAQSGVLFNQFYAAAPVCSPSRAALLTGLNPHKAELPGNASSQEGHKGMPGEKITIAEIMKTNGYKTAHIGKWHIGYSKETMPMAQGFDYTFGHMGGCIDNYSHFFYWNGPNKHDLWENEQEVWHDGQYFGDLMSQKANDFIKANATEPFFMYYAINMPHYPLQPKAKWRKYYEHLEMPRRDYAAFISTIDENIGQLLSTLETEGIRNNTIIIFQSDHGHSNETRTFGSGGNAGPYRGSKFSLFEGGIRVPAIISYPAGIKENQKRSQMAISTDWLPTIADYCKLHSVPENIEGKSLRAVIENNTPSLHKQLIWKSGGSWAIRSGRWKLIGYPQDHSGTSQLHLDDDLLFLVDMSKDIGEQHNLAQQFPEKTELLKQNYLQWEYASKDDIPKKRKSINHLAKGKKANLTTAAHKKYQGQGGSSLTDGEKGTRFYNDGFWIGFEKDDAEIIIDLENATNFNKISIDAMNNPEAWIFLPSKVELAWSSDGINYSKPIIQKVTPKDPFTHHIQTIDILQEDMHGRYIKLKVCNIGTCPQWHQGKGNKAWLFIDEVAVY